MGPIKKGAPQARKCRTAVQRVATFKSSPGAAQHSLVYI